MNILKAVWRFLTEKKVKTVSEPLVDTPTVSPVAPSEIDLVLAKLKTLLIAAEHDVEDTFDKFADLAKALAAKA